ncbi:unnamed protein product [Linum trigynum]|uniref:Uncharacterized protein n=1 Tax=Linum trigynum TaxID=586398 RepID=A0AAV2FEA4_9ROSI
MTSTVGCWTGLGPGLVWAKCNYYLLTFIAKTWQQERLGPGPTIQAAGSSSVPPKQGRKERAASRRDVSCPH